MDYFRHLILPSKENNFKSKFLQSNLLLYCVIFLLVAKIFLTLISIGLPQNIFFADITKSALQIFINQTRQSAGLVPLSESAKLDQAAQLKAENMLQEQYFDHVSPSGISPWFWFSKAGYSYKYAGENLAIGFYDSQEVYDAWLNSPSHKANILNPNYTEVGTAVLSGFGQNNSIVVVQDFGSPLPVKPAAVQPKANQPTKPQQPVAPKNNEIVLPTGAALNNLPSKVANYVLFNYNELLQNIIYAVSLVVIGVLMTLIFFSININFKKQLVFRAVLIVVLLSAATLLDKGIIISFIPHQILI